MQRLLFGHTAKHSENKECSFLHPLKVVFPTLSKSGPARSQLLSFVTGVTDFLYGCSVTLLISVVKGVTDCLYVFSVTFLLLVVTGVTDFLYGFSVTLLPSITMTK